jgi:hypothetical protein
MAAMPGLRGRAVAVFQAALFFSLCALTHPITGALGAVVLLALVAMMTIAARDRLFFVSTCTAAAIVSAVVLSPWLYAVASFGRDLPIAAAHRLMTQDFDTIWSRLAPFPVDVRSLVHGRYTETPHLDAQLDVSVALLLLSMWLAYRFPHAGHGEGEAATPLFGAPAVMVPFASMLTWLAAIGLVYLLIVSIGFDAHLVPPLIARVQYGYRLVSYQNICLLLLALAATQHFGRRAYNSEMIVAGVAVALTVSFSGVLLKLAHANVARHGAGVWHDADKLLELPSTLYSIGDYNVLRGSSPSPPGDGRTLRFVPARDAAFGEVPPLSLDANGSPGDPEVVKTNVYAFPWNEVVLDSQPAPPQHYSASELARTTETYLTSVHLPRGIGTVSYRFTPDRVWNLFNGVSTLVALLWIAALCVEPMVRRRNGTPNRLL